MRWRLTQRPGALAYRPADQVGSGETATRAVPPGSPLAKVQREVGNYRRFKAVVEQIVEVNERICEARPLTDTVEAAPDGQRGLYEEVEADFQAEVARLSPLAVRQLIEPSGLGLEVAESAIRTAMLTMGRGLLERVLDLDHGLPGPEVYCERMRHAHYRELGVFVGSGIVQAGCNSVIAHRLKQSGMRCSVRGSAAILSFRCQEATGPSRWGQIWPWLHFETTVA